MARLKLTRGVGPVTTALMLFDLWRRLPPTQRRWVARQARTHGPRIAKQAVAAQKRRSSKR